MTNKKVLVFPGAFQYVKNYGEYDGVDIWLGEKMISGGQTPDYIIGHSAGGVFALVNHYHSKTKFILINPFVPQRGVAFMFWSLARFLVGEGIPPKKIVNLKYWPHSLRLLAGLVGVDVMGAIKNLPRENVLIVRGSRDDFFCDLHSAEFIKENGVDLIEVDAGHDWNQNIAERVSSIING